MGNNTSFWNNKNVFITGINGFIGGNLAKRLYSSGAKIFGLIRDNKKDTYIYIEDLADKITLINGDIVDRDLLSRIISEEQIDCVFHLAAQVEVGVAISNPYLTFETNIRGTYSLLEAIRIHPVRSVVIASTDKSYGSYGIDQMPYKETYPLIPQYPYDVSKACADMIAQSYSTELYDLPVIVTRFCNIFGPGQLNFSALIPDSIRSALGYSTFIPRGNGKQVRDFIYVDDVVNLYLMISQELLNNPKRISGEIFNAGTNSPVRTRDIIRQIYLLIGNKSDYKKVEEKMLGKQTSGEIDYQYMDFQKVNNYFGWEPEHSLNEGLEKTIEWFIQYLKQYSKKE